ncbi:MAG: UDP-N-acetyl-D-mannosamine dehydrogenase [Sphingosinicella sp.]|nr:UDP-N-acetyl-D-mannosamine dehydrogenase [Sphingosinicella sp.]
MVMIEQVCVVGLGYIGLPTAALLAASGFRVLGADIDERVVATINQGLIHIVEPDLDGIVHKVVAEGSLSAATTAQPADVFMLCVPTPFHDGEGDPQPNIDYVLAATRAIAPLVRPGNLVILESTSPVGTTERIAEELQAAGVDIGQVHIAYCPERVLPGKILTELVENDRIVGGLTEAAASAVGSFYRHFVRGRVLETDARTAEMCKLTENSFRDLNIAFANELSVICDNQDIDVWKLIALANCHPRVNILQPGPGVGGHCIAVDPWFIVARDPQNARLIRQARLVNDGKTDWVVAKVREAAQAQQGAKIACLGLAFKPDIDDLRESPAMEVALALAEEGLETLNVEPNLSQHPDLSLVTIDEALEQADIVVILVRHRQFLDPGFSDRLAGKTVLDFCGALAQPV